MGYVEPTTDGGWIFSETGSGGSLFDGDDEEAAGLEDWFAVGGVAEGKKGIVSQNLSKYPRTVWPLVTSASTK
jgi:hypothetical protein